MILASHPVKHAPVELASFEISAYTPAYHSEVVRLIKSIQEDEFGLAFDYKDHFDLQDIDGIYQNNSGNFWLVLHDDAVIGTMGFVDAGHNIGVIKKFFLHQDYRGKTTGIAQKMFDTVQDWAKSTHFKHIYLGTEDRFIAAMRFYERNGFNRTSKETLPTAINKTRAQVDTMYFYKAI